MVSFNFLFLALLLSLKLLQNFMNPLQLAPKTIQIFTHWVRQQRSNASESLSKDTVQTLS
jgi:hypothetical protein